MKKIYIFYFLFITTVSGIMLCIDGENDSQKYNLHNVYACFNQSVEEILDKVRSKELLPNHPCFVSFLEQRYAYLEQEARKELKYIGVPDFFADFSNAFSEERPETYLQPEELHFYAEKFYHDDNVRKPDLVRQIYFNRKKFNYRFKIFIRENFLLLLTRLNIILFLDILRRKLFKTNVVVK